jgi:HSP20 family protein
MNIIPWRAKKPEPTVEPAETSLATLRDEMTRLFERFFREPFDVGLPEAWPAAFGRGVRMDLAESENDVVIKAELPGVDPKDVEINVTGNMLTVRGEKKEEKEEKKRDYHFVERSHGSFHRSLQLPSSVNPEKIDATFKNGVLTVKLAKRAEAKPKRITVRSA